MKAIGVIGAVGEHLARSDPGDHATGRCHVVLLAGADFEANRQAERIDYGMEEGLSGILCVRP